MNGTNTTCVFWDPNLDNGNGAFSTEGGSLLRDDEDSAECEFYHLTSFAILLVSLECIYYKLPLNIGSVNNLENQNWVD